MKLTEREYKLLKEALGYGVVYSQSESETSEFVLLKMKIEKGLMNMIKGNDIKPKSLKQFSDVKSFPDCPFHYCDSNPACKEKCRYS